MAATKRKMNFTNVKDGGQFNPRHVEPGDYVMKITKVEDGKSKEGNEQWIFTCTRKGDQRASYPYYVGVDEKQAWKVRKLFIACGLNVPKKMVMVDPNKLVGKEFGAFLEEDEYEGRMKSRIQETFPVDEVSGPDDDDEDERPAKKKSAKKSKAAPEPDEDEDEDVDLEEEDEEEEDSADDDEDEDEEEEEPEPVVVKKKTKKAAAAPVKKAATKKKKVVVEDDDDEDLELDEL